MKTILVPVDFSDYARHALNLAIELCERINGKIILLHVFDAPVVKDGTVSHATQDDLQIFFKENLIKQVKTKLENWGSVLKEKHVNHHMELLYGNPYQRITEQISQQKADLIVMGSKGASGLREVFIGSNAERVVRESSCPVIIVKDACSLSEIRSITFGTDAAEEMDKVAETVRTFQELLNVKVHLVKIKTFANESKDAVIDQLHRFAQRNHLSDYTLNAYDSAFPDEGIVKFAEEIHSGLIIIGTHGSKGLYHLIAGSWAEDLVNQSKIPVMTVRV